MRMASILKAYLSLLSRHPVKVQAATTGVLMSSGDVIAQFVIERKSLSQYSTKRTARFAIFGFCLLGPTLSLWYKYLDRVVKSSGARGALYKILLDQVLMAPAVLGTFFTVMTFWSSGSAQLTIDTLKRDYFPVLLVNYQVWPAAQAINFYFVPLNQRVLFAGFVALFWNTFLSFRASSFGDVSSEPDKSEGKE